MRITLEVVVSLVKDDANDVLPRDEGEIGNRALPPNEPRPILARGHLLLRQDLFQDARDALNFLDVAVEGAGQILVVELLEPGGLAVVGALTRRLEVEELPGLVRLGTAGREADFVACVVLFDEVLDDGPGLPQGNVGVWVVDGRQASVGVDGQVFGLLDIGQGHDDGLVGKAKLLEDDGDLGRVGATLAPDFDWLDAGHGGGVWTLVWWL